MAGNKNSGKRAATLFYDSLTLALNDSKEPGQRLRRIAEKLVRQAESGEQWAIREVADRLDGKPAQTVRGDEEAPVMVKTIERVIIDPEGSDA